MRSRSLCLVLLYVGLLWTLAACGIFHPFGHTPDPTGVAMGHPGPFPPLQSGSGEHQLFAILTWLIWVTIVGGCLAFVASLAFPVVPTKVSAGSVLLGVGLAYLKDLLIDYGWALKVALAVGVALFVWPYAVSYFRWNTARKTGEPIKGHTGWAALRQLWPFGSVTSSPDGSVYGGAGGLVDSPNPQEGI